MQICSVITNPLFFTPQLPLASMLLNDIINILYLLYAMQFRFHFLCNLMEYLVCAFFLFDNIVFVVSPPASLLSKSFHFLHFLSLRFLPLFHTSFPLLIFPSSTTRSFLRLPQFPFFPSLFQSSLPPLSLLSRLFPPFCFFNHYLLYVVG